MTGNSMVRAPKEHPPGATAHFNPGHYPVAFVFSVPGAKEKTACMPVAGRTGENLSKALVYLSRRNPRLFPSTYRYDYRIANAFTSPMWAGNSNGRTEACNSEIRAKANLERVVGEISDCAYVALCGKKAGLIMDTLIANLTEAGRPIPVIVRVPHLSAQGLLSLDRELAFTGRETREERVDARIRHWAGLLAEGFGV